MLTFPPARRRAMLQVLVATAFGGTPTVTTFERPVQCDGPFVYHKSMERRIETERLTGAMTTWYYLHGEQGCVQFMLMYIAPMGTYLPLDVGVHSHAPLYEGHEPQPCAALKGKCYFSPNPLAADKVFQAFRESHDPETIWSELEHVYRTTF